MESPAVNLSSLVRRGGVFYRVPGKQPRDILDWLAGAVTADGSPENSAESAGRKTFRETLLQAVLEREELMPTAMGNGIALPHPRNPVITKSEEAFAALAFPQNEIDWKALDGKPVNAVIMVVSASAKMHLHTLQRITFFCRNEAFCRLLEQRAPAEDFFAFIEKTEKGWG